MESILQESKECYITHKTEELHKHHIFEGRNRQVSEDNGFFVYLTPEYHNMSEQGVHNNKAFDLMLKRLCQIKFEQTHSHEEFMRLIGRNYI